MQKYDQLSDLLLLTMQAFSKKHSLPKQTAGALIRSKIPYLGVLMLHRPDTMLSLRGFGKKSLSEVQKALVEEGLSFAMHNLLEGDMLSSKWGSVIMETPTQDLLDESFSIPTEIMLTCPYLGSFQDYTGGDSLHWSQFGDRKSRNWNRWGYFATLWRSFKGQEADLERFLEKLSSFGFFVDPLHGTRKKITPRFFV